jgi:FKBP-type peptidyl-prolyl cis-trans isomerase
MYLMNKLVLLFSAALLVLYCAPATENAPASEVANLRTYLGNAGITATEDARGFFYNIQAPGDSVKPNACANITINYVGRLTNGNQFDGRNGITFDLDNLITGWRQGVPLIGKGGKITLYLPPSLGYGNQPRTGIPANSILIFNIDLLDFN